MLGYICKARHADDHSWQPRGTSSPVSQAAANVHLCNSTKLAAKTLAPLRAGSSRSHCIVILNVERLWPSGRATHCRLLVCDLAGSERQKSVRPFLTPL